jgi:hypothetical protein
VAHFKGMTEFFDGLACDLPCLLDFHFVSSCFGESLLPSQGTEGAKTRNRGKRRERRVQGGTGGTLELHGHSVARNVLVETGAGIVGGTWRSRSDWNKSKIGSFGRLALRR